MHAGRLWNTGRIFEALTLIQTHKTYPFPLILVGKDYWNGLMDWITSVMLKEKTISEEDLHLIKITDDPEEVLSIMNTHKTWKLRKIKESMRKKKGNKTGSRKP